MPDHEAAHPREAMPLSGTQLTAEDLRRAQIAGEVSTRLRLIGALREGGPRSRNVVIGIVGGLDAYNRIVRPMLAAGELVMKRARGGRIHLGRVT